MFNKIGLLALAAPLVNALTLNIPSNPVSGEPLTITWTFTPGDTVFTIELFNQVFHNAFALANNVQPELGSMDITMPIVPPGDGYTLAAVNIGDINQVFASTGDFSIAPNPSISASSVTSTTVTSISAAPSGSVTGTALSTVATGSTTRVGSASSAFGSTVTAPSNSATRSATTSAQSNTASATNLNNGVLPNYKFGGNKGAVAGALLSVLAGAAIVVL